MLAERSCPHCGDRMNCIETPLESTWGGEIHHVCFNDECCYFEKSWDALKGQGIKGTAYRYREDPRGGGGPLPVWSTDALKNKVLSMESLEGDSTESTAVPKNGNGQSGRGMPSTEGAGRMQQKPVCPHCGASMSPIETPLDSSWGGEIHFVCFNDECAYFVKSWDTLECQGIEDSGYRCRMDPRGCCGPFAVWSRDALKDKIVSDEMLAALQKEPASEDYYRTEDFAREDETPDGEFYRTPRFVDHLDSLALSTVEELYERLIPKGAKVLDLMAGPSSHVRSSVEPDKLIGLGLNKEELEGNEALSSYVIHDVNEDPKMPFDDNSFDVVINTVSVDYLTRPIELFRDVARVLKPHGLFITVFSNRMFPPKAVSIWKSTDESGRVELVRDFFVKSEAFSLEGYFESKGKPRPADDKYYSLGIPSDPVYAVWGKAL